MAIASACGFHLRAMKTTDPIKRIQAHSIKAVEPNPLSAWHRLAIDHSGGSLMRSLALNQWPISDRNEAQRPQFDQIA
jgi:outer membrane lipopolysaccharide assembly protein LptE/RlpB